MVKSLFDLYSRSSHHLYFIFLSRVKMNSINWPAPNIWVFIAQLVEHCSANAEAMDSNPVEALKFFSGLNLQLLKLQLQLRWSNLYFKNVFLVQDLLGDDGKVVSYSEFFRKFRLNGNFLQYMQVGTAIPKDLIDDARRYHIDKTSIFFESSFQLFADLLLDLLKMKNRNYY